MVYREKQYGDTLCHFNEKHDNLGRFAKKNGGSSTSISSTRPIGELKITAFPNKRFQADEVLNVFGISGGLWKSINKSDVKRSKNWRQAANSAISEGIKGMTIKANGKPYASTLAAVGPGDRAAIAEAMARSISYELYNKGINLTSADQDDIYEEAKKQLDKQFENDSMVKKTADMFRKNAEEEASYARNTKKPNTKINKYEIEKQKAYRMASEGNAKRPHAAVPVKTTSDKLKMLSEGLKNNASSIIRAGKKAITNAVDKKITAVESSIKYQEVVSSGKAFLSKLGFK